MDTRAICICRGEGSGQWIACGSPGCAFQYFHLECLGITQMPLGHWLCPRCRVGTVGIVPSNAMTPGASSPSPRDKKTQNVINAAPKSPKSPKTARIIYETTEASIFENIVAKSREQALKKKSAMLKAAAGPKVEEQWEDSGEKSVRTLVQTMQAKVKEDSRRSKGKMVDRSSYDESKAVEPVEDAADAMDIDVQAVEPVEDVVDAMDIDDQIQKEVDMQIQREMDAQIQRDGVMGTF